MNFKVFLLRACLMYGTFLMTVQAQETSTGTPMLMSSSQATLDQTPKTRAEYDGQPVATYGDHEDDESPRVSTACSEQVGVSLVAVCTFTTPRNSTVRGTLTLTQTGEGRAVTIKGTLTGVMPAGQHGFHVHETGNFSDGCTSALEHYNPQNQSHGGPLDNERHNGDFGNVNSDASGTVQINIVDKYVSLFERYSIIGRSLVIHEMPDDLGKGGSPDSKIGGGAGGRLGCCVIGYAQAG